jgi:hypothetical protein
MPADFSEYVNLRIFDKEPGDIYLDSIELARLVLPEFNLRTGTPEDAIFQAAAYMSALNISAINRLPDRLMAGIMAIMGFQRQEAISAELDVTITLNTYDGGSIPIGTIFSFESLFEDELQEFAFTTTETIELEPTDLEVSVDYPSVSTTIVALIGGVIPPVGDGVELNIISSGTNIQSCIANTPSNFANGINADRDEDYLSKSTTYLRSLSSALTKASQVDAYLLSSYPSLITRVKTYDLTDADNVYVKRQLGAVMTHLAGGVATIETDGEHLFVVGDTVVIQTNSSSVSALFDGEHTVTVVEDTAFRYSISTATTSASTSISGSVTAGADVPGYVSIFAYGVNSELTELEKIQILGDVREKTTAGLSISINDPVLANLTLTADIAISQSFNAVEVEESVETAIVDFLSPISFPYSYDRIRQNQLVSLISQIPGVIYVQNLSISPVGENWLPQLGPDLLFRYKGSLPSIAAEDLSINYTVVDLG